MRKKSLTNFGWNVECWAVQKRGNLVDLVKRFQSSNEYLLAKFGFDTAENEPCEVRKFELSEMLNLNFEISKLLFATQGTLSSSPRTCQHWALYLVQKRFQIMARKSYFFYLISQISSNFSICYCVIIFNFFWKFLKTHWPPAIIWRFPEFNSGKNLC